MVRPYDFGFNEETGIDNEFQKRPELSTSEINHRAGIEFQEMVDKLRSHGVRVLILEPSHTPPLVRTPDALFPNDWLSTEHDGTLITYPMMAENRKAERRLADVEKLLSDSGYYIRNSISIGRQDEDDCFLEGTGSLIIDHSDEVVYAAVSNRCHPDQFYNFIKLRFYKEGILFETRSSTGKPIYHTNVMMSLGENFALVGLDCIPVREQRDKVLGSLRKSFSDVIELTPKQVEASFCGNILALRNCDDRPLIVMSQRAHSGLYKEQLDRLAKHGEIVTISIHTIETVGGGSARSMMTEVFSPRLEDFDLMPSL
jgi:hypothetical protein